MHAEALALIAAFLLAALPGHAAINGLRRLGAKQNISEDAPTGHSAKQGTPTMGGLLILASLTVVTMVYFALTQVGAHRHPDQDLTLPVVLLVTLAFGSIGFLDDFLSARRGKNLGLRAREKMAAQIVVTVTFLLWLARSAQPGLTTSVSVVPPVLGVPPLVVDMGWWYYLAAGLFIVGFSNATNFTDGLDGLSSGLVILICVALGTLVGTSLFPALGVFCLTLAGALAGFLWWNAHPATVFMGDTGSLALGAGLSCVAILGKHEVGLIIASLVCWAELLSVVIQVVVFKWRKRRYGIENARSNRVFKRAPLHHHFEELGWPETRVVTRFWIAGAVCAALSLLWSVG